MLPDEGWPEHIRVATPNPREAPSVSSLRPFVQFIEDPSTKEILITGRGIRLVHRLAESDQTLYRVTRRADLGFVDLSPERLAPILAALVGIGDALARRHGR